MALVGSLGLREGSRAGSGVPWALFPTPPEGAGLSRIPRGWHPPASESQNWDDGGASPQPEMPVRLTTAPGLQASLTAGVSWVSFSRWGDPPDGSC